VNGQIGVGDSKYVVICDPLLLSHMIRRMCSDRIYSPAKVNEERCCIFLENRWSYNHKTWPTYQAD